MDIINFSTFVVTTLFFIMTPGLDTVFVVNKSIAQGKRNGLYATLGVHTGLFMHILLATLGFTIIIANSALLYTLVRYWCAIYILLLGVTRIRSGNNSYSNAPSLEKESAKKSFSSGFFSNALNPKLVFLFMGFFPKYIAPASLQKPVPFLVLGFTYTCICLLWFSFMNTAAVPFVQKMTTHPNVEKNLNLFSGIVFIFMGLNMFSL